MAAYLWQSFEFQTYGHNMNGERRSKIEYLIKSKIRSLVALVGSRGFQFQTSYPLTAYLKFQMATTDIDYWTVLHFCRFLKHKFQLHTLRTSSSFLAPDSTLYERDTDEKINNIIII